MSKKKPIAKKVNKKNPAPKGNGFAKKPSPKQPPVTPKPPVAPKPAGKKIIPQNWMHSKIFKLKDRGGKGGLFFDVKSIFGFRPEWVSVTKIVGKNNTFILSVEKTPEMLAAEHFAREEMRRQLNKKEDKIITNSKGDEKKVS